MQHSDWTNDTSKKVTRKILSPGYCNTGEANDTINKVNGKNNYSGTLRRDRKLPEEIMTWLL